MFHLSIKCQKMLLMVFSVTVNHNYVGFLVNFIYSCSQELAKLSSMSGDILQHLSQ